MHLNTRMQVRRQTQDSRNQFLCEAAVLLPWFTVLATP